MTTETPHSRFELFLKLTAPLLKTERANGYNPQICKVTFTVNARTVDCEGYLSHFGSILKIVPKIAFAIFYDGLYIIMLPRLIEMAKSTNKQKNLLFISNPSLLKNLIFPRPTAGKLEMKQLVKLSTLKFIARRLCIEPRPIKTKNAQKFC